MLAAVVGLTVLSWTGSQTFAYNRPEGRDDLLLLTKARRLGELAVEQGVLAALTPLRDVVGLGVEPAAAGRRDGPPLPGLDRRLGRRAAPPRVDGRGRGAPGWANVGWGCGGAADRSTGWSRSAPASADLPLGGCLMVEAAVVPVLMAVCDGLLLAGSWSSCATPGFDDAGGDALDAARGGRR